MIKLMSSKESLEKLLKINMIVINVVTLLFKMSHLNVSHKNVSALFVSSLEVFSTRDLNVNATQLDLNQESVIHAEVNVNVNQMLLDVNVINVLLEHMDSVLKDALNVIAIVLELFRITVTSKVVNVNVEIVESMADNVMNANLDSGVSQIVDPVCVMVMLPFVIKSQVIVSTVRILLLAPTVEDV